MDINIIYEDEYIIVVDKPAGVVVFHEALSMKHEAKTVIDLLVEKYPELKKAGEAPRYGIVHRLDKDTSGVLLVAKSSEALIFLQKQFKNREVGKKYIALATGVIKDDSGTIKTFIERSPADPRKQRAVETGEREAVTEYKVLERFKDYTLLEVTMKTGRKHQIRCHLAHIHHPIAGDKLYGFKDSPKPEDLERQFLHASYVSITLPNGILKEFTSDISEDLQKVLKNIS